MNPRRQRGVALIAAVLVVALATVLIAAMLDRGEASLARTRNLLRAGQGWELMRGMEAWAGAVLKQDLELAPGMDSRDDIWAQELPPIDLPGVRIFGRLHERNGCFNLNSLHPDGNDDSVAIARRRSCASTSATATGTGPSPATCRISDPSNLMLLRSSVAAAVICPSMCTTGCGYPLPCPLALRRCSSSCQVSVRRTSAPRTGRPSKMNLCSSDIHLQVAPASSLFKPARKRRAFSM